MVFCSGAPAQLLRSRQHQGPATAWSPLGQPFQNFLKFICPMFLFEFLKSSEFVAGGVLGHHHHPSDWWRRMVLFIGIYKKKKYFFLL
jgi:hypothetical protein